MRRLSIASFLALLFALPLAAQAPVRRSVVERCLNVAFDGFTRMPPMPGTDVPDHVDLAFLRRPQTINLNVALAPVLPTSRAQYRVLGEGARESASGLSYRGVMLRGRPAQRTWFATPRKSEVGLLLADCLDLRVSIAPTEGPDDVLPIAERLDLDCLEAAARSRR